MLGQNGLKRSGGGDFSKVQCFFMKCALHIFAALKELRKEIEKKINIIVYKHHHRFLSSVPNDSSAVSSAQVIYLYLVVSARS